MSVTLDQAVAEWVSKKRKRGCASATQWLCKRVEGFYPKRITRYTDKGEIYQHVVATNGYIVVDLTPEKDSPSTN